MKVIEKDWQGNFIRELDTNKRHFIAYFYTTGWHHISLGFHICLKNPNIEIHLPFGYFRVGWVKEIEDFPKKTRFLYRAFGYDWK